MTSPESPSARMAISNPTVAVLEERVSERAVATAQCEVPELTPFGERSEGGQPFRFRVPIALGQRECRSGAHRASRLEREPAKPERIRIGIAGDAAERCRHSTHDECRLRAGR